MTKDRSRFKTKMNDFENKVRSTNASSDDDVTYAECTDEKALDLLNLKIPTGMKAQKRKHLNTNFNDSLYVDQSSLDAQRKEKERLKRLERQKQAHGDSDHIQQVASVMSKPLTPLPVLDAFDPDVICLIGGDSSNERDCRIGFASSSSCKAEPEVIELSSDDEDEKHNIKGNESFAPYRVVPPFPSNADYGKRPRWTHSEKDRREFGRMEKQHRIEKERIRKRRSSNDLEKIELTQTGRLLVNAGHGPEDPDVHVSPYLTHILQPHQLGGVRFMYDNIVESVCEFSKSPGFGCILAHSMGLGKTIQVIAFTEIFLRVTEARTVLIIVPVNTIQNWYNEFEKWLPRYMETGELCRHFDVFLLGDSIKTFDQRVNMIEKWMQKGGVLLIGYEMFRLLIRSTQPKKPAKMRHNSQDLTSEKDIKLDGSDQGLTAEGRIKKEANDIICGALVDPGPDLVVCDEGHKIKNLNTDIASALGAVKTRRRIVLTGYPLQNNLMEYYCMVDFVRPDYLGSKKTFALQFEKPIKNGQCIDSTPGDVKIARQRIHVLNNMLKGFIQRRTHHLLRAILPESKEFVVLLRKSPLQHALYRNFVMYAKSEISSGNTSVFNPLKAFAACSKISDHANGRSFEKVQALTTNCISPNSTAINVQPATCDSLSRSCSTAPTTSCEAAVSSSGCNLSIGPVPSSTVILPTKKSIESELKLPLRVTHGDLWSGLFTDEVPESPGTDIHITRKDDDSKFPARVRRSPRGKPKTVQGVMEEEFEMIENDQGLQYDWAEIAMASYKVGNIEHGYKMVIAMELLDASVRMGEKMLIFSQNLTALDLIEYYLCRRPLVKSDGAATSWMKSINYFRLDGSTPGSERERLIQKFNLDPGVHLFLISTKAGSLGINLVAASRCIILDACWNPCHDAQAVCRVYRYGQQRRTYIYRLILNNCMEKAIFNRQISKHGLQQRVVDDAQVDANITQKELETLLMYDESLDVIHEKWETSQWKLGDEVLESVVRSRSEMLAEEPFLHESLMLEREEGLSEEEKKEAELWFAMEQRKEEIVLPYNGPAVPQPHAFYGGQMPPLGDHSGWHPYLYLNSMMNPPPRPTPIPSTIHRVPLPFSGAPAAYQMGFSLPSSNGMLTGNRMDGLMGIPRRVPPFPGAAVAFEPSSNSRGSVQLIKTDRALSLPVVSHPSERREIPSNTQAMLVRSADGIFLRLSNGLLLNAQNSVFDTAMHSAPPVVTIPPDLPRPLRLPSPLKSTPDLIELD